MIRLVLFLVGVVVAVVSCIVSNPNGITVLGVLAMLPAVAHGITHDVYIQFGRLRAVREKKNK